jgi:hypothetical protein
MELPPNTHYIIGFKMMCRYDFVRKEIWIINGCIEIDRINMTRFDVEFVSQYSHIDVIEFKHLDDSRSQIEEFETLRS